jgi:hypothetical protein
MPVVVMVIVVVMIVMVMMVITMIVRCMVMRRVVMRIAVAGVGVAAAGIGAAFGIEWRLDLDHARAQAFDHRLDDVIAPDAQAFCHDLRRQMAIAEMPGNANQMTRIGPSDLDQRLRRRNHLDQPPVFQHQGIAAAQRDGVFQIEQELKSPCTRHRHPPPVPVVEIEHHSIGRRFGPAMLPLDLSCADHANMPRFFT